jgi:hypothetical protein
MGLQLNAGAAGDPAEISAAPHAEIARMGTRQGKACSPVAMIAGDKQPLDEAESQRSANHEQRKADV